MNCQKLILNSCILLIPLVSSSCSTLWEFDKPTENLLVYNDLRDVGDSAEQEYSASGYNPYRRPTIAENFKETDLRANKISRVAEDQQANANPYANRDIPAELEGRSAFEGSRSSGQVASGQLALNNQQKESSGFFSGVKKFFTFEKASPSELAAVGEAQNNVGSETARARLNLNNTNIQTDYHVPDQIVSNRNYWLGKLNFPVRHPEIKISSEFGWRRGKFHEGVDLAAPYGSTVEAAHDGKVLYVGDQLGSYGNLVVLQSQQGLVSVYGHNSKVYVNTGDQVHAGQVISLIGTSGDTTGPHLHFEARLPNEKGDYVAVQPKGMFEGY